MKLSVLQALVDDGVNADDVTTLCRAVVHFKDAFEDHRRRQVLTTTGYCGFQKINHFSSLLLISSRIRESITRDAESIEAMRTGT